MCVGCGERLSDRALLGLVEAGRGRALLSFDEHELGGVGLVVRDARRCGRRELQLDAAGAGLYAALTSTCLIRRAALHLSQREFEPALEAASEALALAPHSKNAGSLLASAQHKAGKKKAASSTLCGLCALFVADVVAEPSITGTHEDRWDEALERTVGLLLDCNRSKDALKLLNALAARVDSLAASGVFRIVAELCVRHGLKKDALHSKMFSLCAAAPDEATLAFLHTMTLALPTRPTLIQR